MTDPMSQVISAFTADRPLAEALAASPLVGQWLEQSAGVDPVYPSPDGPAPLFTGPWPRQYLAAAHAEDPDRLSTLLDRLQAGGTQVVVTGQQPGLVGGPLYSLYKIATCVALAKRLSAAGRPTLPVFWSGDDDDDLLEAAAPVWWDVPAHSLRGGAADLKKLGRPAERRPVGDLTVGRFPGEDSQWLDSLAGAGFSTELGIALAGIRRLAVDQQWRLSRWYHVSLRRIFRDTDLVIISGNDPNLHAAGEAFYSKVGPRLPDLSAQARTAGQALEARGFYAQISDRSLARPLFRLQDGQRVPVTEFVPGPASGDLRPGVMLRSLLQDWLLRPAAVVVGPGEAGYLAQLAGLYRTLDIPRAPLVPRLFGWLLPPAFPADTLARFTLPAAPPESLALTLGAELVTGTEDLVQRALAEKLGLAPDRARQLARGRSRRWGKGVQSLLEQEISRLRSEARPARPAWVFPQGQRQERLLGSFWAAGLGGDAFIGEILTAADRHLELGRQSTWHEFTARATLPGEGDFSS